MSEFPALIFIAMYIDLELAPLYCYVRKHNNEQALSLYSTTMENQPQKGNRQTTTTTFPEDWNNIAGLVLVCYLCTGKKMSGSWCSSQFLNKFSIKVSIILLDGFSTVQQLSFLVVNEK